MAASTSPNTLPMTMFHWFPMSFARACFPEAMKSARRWVFSFANRNSLGIVMINSDMDARNGKSVNDPGPTTNLKINHPAATAAAIPPIHPTKPEIVERNQADDQVSAKDIGPPAIIAPNLDAKNDRGTTRIYAIIVFTSAYSYLMYSSCQII